MTDQLAEIKVKALDPREPWARMGDEFWWLVTEVERLRVALAEAETANELLRVEGTEESRADLEDALSEVDELSLAVVALRGALTGLQTAIVRDAVADAMQTAWDSFVGDTGCYPDCFHRHGSMLTANFDKGNFAQMVADAIAARAVAAGVLNQGATDGGD